MNAIIGGTVGLVEGIIDDICLINIVFTELCLFNFIVQPFHPTVGSHYATECLGYQEFG